MRMLDSQVIYQKKTWNPRGLGCGIVLLVFFCAPWFFVYQVLSTEGGVPDLGWWRWLAAAVMGFFPLFVCTIAFPLWFLVWRRTIRVTGTHLEIWRGPFKNLGISQKFRFRLDKIKTMKQVGVDSLHSWEMINGNTTVYSSKSMGVRELASSPGLYCGPHALHLTDTKGQSFNVGTPEPDVLAAVLMKARPGITLEETEPSGSN